MGCGSCGTTGGCSPKGCKSNGTCGTTGCNKLNVYNWLSDMALPEDFKPFNIVEVRFKGNRKHFYRNSPMVDLYTGDYVVVQSETGQDVGQVSLSGELVRLQLKKYNVTEDSEHIKEILRTAHDKDLSRYNELKDREKATLERARTVAMNLGLNMKLSDIEFQGDGRKVTFLYTAEERVDFRELIKIYAEEFKTRIEMRQIGYRQEAARLGGIGSCGRELCCSTWLSDFKMVNTGAARYQNLSINMLKLSGQCGRLKCCLNYELDTYIEAVNEFPKQKSVKLDTVNGPAYSHKIDILKRLMWFSYPDSPTWVPLPLAIVKELIAKNEKGEKVQALMELAPVTAISEKMLEIAEMNSAIEFNDEDITRLDKKRDDSRNKNKNFNKRRENGPNNGPTNRPPQNSNRPPQQQTNHPPNQQNRPPQNNPNRPPQQNAGDKGPQNQRPVKPFKQNRNNRPGGPRPNNPAPPETKE